MKHEIEKKSTKSDLLLGEGNAPILEGVRLLAGREHGVCRSAAQSR